MIKKKFLIKNFNTKDSLLFVDRGREELFIQMLILQQQ